MKIAGIISEFNPFHRGHEYLIRKTKEETGAEYVIALMSGNFVQRGEPAVFDMGLRTEMALKGGADAVFELSPTVSLSSAEGFAQGGVRLCQALGVDILSFGSESGSLESLNKIAEILAFESDEYKEKLRSALKEGMNFPAAREKALSDNRELQDEGLSPAILHEILQNPNNILGIEYIKGLKRIKSPIICHTTGRIRSPYHENVDISVNSVDISPEDAEKSLFSAESIRNMLYNNRVPEDYEGYMKYGAVSRDALTSPLLFILNSVNLEEKMQKCGVPEDLSRRILNNRGFNGSFSEFCELLKTKNITFTSVSRSLLRLILDTKAYEPADSLNYIRLLGFRKASKKALSEISSRSGLSIISNSSDINTYINEHPEDNHLQDSLRIDRHYELLRDEDKRREYPLSPEISREIVII